MLKNTLYTALVLLVSLGVQGQKKAALAKADSQYDKYAYVDAIKTYERIYKGGYKSADILQKLGNSYYFKADLEGASKYYGELMDLNQEVEPEYYYRYAQSLKAIKDYNKADKMLALFNQKSGNDSRAKLAANQKDYLEVIKKNYGRFNLDNCTINSPYSDYGSAFYNNDKLIFCSARSQSTISQNKQEWTGEEFTDLYQSNIVQDGQLASTKNFSNVLNSKYHESTPVFTKDGGTVYFTRNNYLNNNRGTDEKATTLLKIYKAELKGGKWTNVKSLPFNSDLYSVAHPALSTDEKTLYFASNMPGTIGQSDIFKVAIVGDDSYGKPVNLGSTVNTEGRETFPFISADNQLYFATDGHPGLGGLDVFVSNITGIDQTYGSPINLGEPLNSPKDDFSFIINTETREGYVTSNRDGGVGSDDIYHFKELKKIEKPCEQLLAGILTDSQTGNIIPDAKVTLSDSSYKEKKVVMTDSEGKFYLGTVTCGEKYYIKSESTGYNTQETPTLIEKVSGKTYVPIALEKTEQAIKVGDDLAKKLDIPIIYFDLDKSFIREDAAVELAKVLDVMMQNPGMKIDVRSHTDCRNTAQYNAALSTRRNKETIAWLVEKGIDEKRLTGKGYGESRLRNKCKDGVQCTEEEHQVNRRSEFIVVTVK
jgi:outer membrane protein OmpA-like peptidoglycan-associated protein/tetratricopeptide (TPR) repeat protein